MRTFYEKIQEATLSKTPEAAAQALREAFGLGEKLITQARARCEFNSALDYAALMQYAARTCGWEHFGRKECPDYLWVFGTGSFGSLGSPRHRSSLDYRQGVYAEIPESWLPSVPLWTRGP